VLFAGPPLVITETETNTLNVAMNCIIKTNRVVGDRRGA
jgi:hypothetical protein